MDNIAIINGKAAMSYQGEAPWHKLGIEMTTKANVVEALKTATLDWNVELQTVHLADGTIIPDKYAVIRDVDNTALGIVGDQYKPLQNNEAFGVLTPACKKFGVTIETAGALGKGEHVWMLAKMPTSVEPIPGDKVDGYFLISTGHNGAIPYTARLTPIRVVCQNTLNLAMSEGENLFKLRHVESDIEQLSIVEHLITNLIEAMKITGDSFTELANKKFSTAEVWGYIDAVFNYKQDETVDIINQIFKINIPQSEKESSEDKRRKQVYELVWNGAGSELARNKKDSASVWSAYNAVVEYVDHVRPAEMKQDSSTIKANKSALFGNGANTKIRALKLALAA